jgi:hypothetical protein
VAHPVPSVEANPEPPLIIDADCGLEIPLCPIILASTALEVLNHPGSQGINIAGPDASHGFCPVATAGDNVAVSSLLPLDWSSLSHLCSCTSSDSLMTPLKETSPHEPHE